MIIQLNLQHWKFQCIYLKQKKRILCINVSNNFRLKIQLICTDNSGTTVMMTNLFLIIIRLMFKRVKQEKIEIAINLRSMNCIVVKISVSKSHQNPIMYCQHFLHIIIQDIMYHQGLSGTLFVYWGLIILETLPKHILRLYNSKVNKPKLQKPVQISTRNNY